MKILSFWIPDISDTDTPRPGSSGHDIAGVNNNLHVPPRKGEQSLTPAVKPDLRYWRQLRRYDQTGRQTLNLNRDLEDALIYVLLSGDMEP